MTSSSEPVLTALATPELRGGDWTRYAGAGALGDAVTERALSALADGALEAARARGYATGWAQGRRQAAEEARTTALETEAAVAAAEARRRDEHDAALAVMAEAVRTLQATTTAVSARLEADCLDLAYELTELLVGHQVRTSPDPAADLHARVAAALPVLGDGVPVTVRVHPAQAARLRELLDGAAAVVEDATVAAGGAVVESDSAVVDLAVDAALARVRAVLS